MRHVDTARKTCVIRHIRARDEERVGARKERAVRVAQMRRDFLRHYNTTFSTVDESRHTPLNVLRAVPEALGHFERNHIAVHARHDAIDPVAPPRLRLDAEAADHRARLPARAERIAGQRAAVDAQRARIRRRHEARFARANRRPRLPARIDAAEHHERLLREELAVLVRHVAANAAPPRRVRLTVHACEPLCGEFVGVKRRGVEAPAV